MSNGSLTGNTPQFRTAEFSGKNTCKSCGSQIGDTYYRVNGNLACPLCAEQSKLRLPKDNHSAFARSVVFGVGGAIVGLILYSTFAIVTGLVIGYVSLAVGYIVGKTMKLGARGLGGRRYQIVAVLLTYAAVSLSAIPIGISQAVKERQAHETRGVSQSEPAENANPAGGNSPGQSTSPTRPKVDVGKLLMGLVLLGLASPFLELQDPLHGGIGLIILFVGIRIAWKLTDGEPSAILGPFRTAPTSS